MAASSWVTSTTARPSSAAPRSSPSTAAPASGSRLPVGSSASTTRGVVDERARHREALLLAAAELVGQPGRRPVEPEALDQRAPARRRAAGAAGQARGEQHVLLAGQLGDEVVGLEDEARHAGGAGA